MRKLYRIYVIFARNSNTKSHRGDSLIPFGGCYVFRNIVISKYASPCVIIKFAMASFSVVPPTVVSGLFSIWAVTPPPSTGVIVINFIMNIFITFTLAHQKQNPQMGALFLYSLFTKQGGQTLCLNLPSFLYRLAF